jgi:hypothetical protein
MDQSRVGSWGLATNLGVSLKACGLALLQNPTFHLYLGAVITSTAALDSKHRINGMEPVSSPRQQFFQPES